MDANKEKNTNLKSGTFSPEDQAVKQEDASSLDALYEKREWALFSSMCLTLFTLGWNDGTVGPLLPRMQASYNVGSSLSSSSLTSQVGSNFEIAQLYICIYDIHRIYYCMSIMFFSGKI